MRLEIIYFEIFILFNLRKSNAIESMINCAEKGSKNACYTCMGRDMENCKTGTVCCNGACFKLIDKKHDLIMKGCTNEEQEDGSMKRRTYDIPLYWAHNEKVTGEAYYCNGSDYCNASSTRFISFFLMTFCSIYLLFYHFLNYTTTNITDKT